MKLSIRRILDALEAPEPFNSALNFRESAKFADKVLNDSRKASPDSVFVAISGAETDGRLFINAAAERGVVAVFAEKPLPPSVSSNLNVPLFFVADAYAAYAKLAELFQGTPAERMRLLGVTGTNGKTTTAFLMRSIMKSWTGEPCGLISTVEYSTVSRSLAADRTTPDAAEIQAILAEALDSGAADAVIEVSSHSLVQNRLGSAKFAAAVFTNLSGDHLDYHKTMDDYFAAKKMLFTRHLASDGTAVLNIDDPHGRVLARETRDSGIETLTFALSKEADVRVIEARFSLSGMELTLRFPDSAEFAFRSKLCGNFNAANIAGAAAAAFALGAPPEAIAIGVEGMTGVPGRMERCGDANVFVDYAHTDDALENVLSMTRGLLDAEGAGGKLLVLFGCGGDRDKTKRPRMAAVAAKFADKIFVTSDNPRSEQPSAIIADILQGMPSNADFEVDEDRAASIAKAVRSMGPDDALIIAGKGHETYQEINGERFHFDDREIAASVLFSN